MKRFSIIVSVIILVYITTSCTKVVNINLNSSNPKLIIESGISDQAGSCRVQLSKSVNYNESNVFPPVSGANITIADNLGNTITLSETSAGIYTAPLFQGVAGRTYTLTVNAEGKSYTAISTMPFPVTIDTLVQDSASSGGFIGGGGGKKHIFVWALFRDPTGINNYYRFVEEINHRINPNIYIMDDELRDGTLITRRISERDSTLKAGDSVHISLESIDKNVFTYYDMVDQLSGGGFGGQSATPANPTSNFDNGAFGYFSAYAVKTKLIVIR